MRAVGVIPSRWGSTRFPGKSLALIGGKPLLAWVLERVRQATRLDEILVATDDERIAAAARSFGAAVAMTRADHPSGTDRIAEAIRDIRADVVVNIQGDEPLIDPALVAACAERLQAHPECVMSTAAHTIDSVEEYLNPNVVKVVTDAAGRALYFSRAPMPWWRDGHAQGVTALPDPAPLRHIGIYGYTAGFLRRFPALPPAPLEQIESLEQLRVLWHGERIVVHLSPQRPGPGVDTPEDLARVRRIFEQRSSADTR